mmetsp:Transcript_108323/g.314870  ORF Transcript_108323/g.314870 Transcript_108323/m.314870 type:complete len:251 (-) Transcript_108323:410-1162(-)
MAELRSHFAWSSVRCFRSSYASDTSWALRMASRCATRRGPRCPTGSDSASWSEESGCATVVSRMNETGCTPRASAARARRSSAAAEVAECSVSRGHERGPWLYPCHVVPDPSILGTHSSTGRSLWRAACSPLRAAGKGAVRRRRRAGWRRAAGVASGGRANTRWDALHSPPHSRALGRRVVSRLDRHRGGRSQILARGVPRPAGPPSHMDRVVIVGREGRRCAGVDPTVGCEGRRRSVEVRRVVRGRRCR